MHVHRSSRRAERGLSLIELLFAALLVTTIAVFLAPMFVRAIASNTYGGEATLVANEARTLIERNLALPFDHPDISVGDGDLGADLLDPADDDPTFRVLQEAFWYNPMPRASDLLSTLPDLGQSRWINEDDPSPPTTISGERLYEMEIRIREFSYRDIGTVISAADNTVLIQLGHPDLFDTPIEGNSPVAFRHLKELEASIRGNRQSGALGVGQVLRVRRMRSY